MNTPLEIDLYRLDRRAVLRNLALAAGVAGGSAILGRNLLGPDAAFAQDATPTAQEFPPAGLPLLEVSVLADFATTVSPEVQAGTLTLRASSALEGYCDILVLQVPDDVSDADVEAAVNSDGTPEFLFRSIIAADISIEPGVTPSTIEAVIELAPGTWYVAVVWDGPGSATKIQAVGEAVTVPIEADVDVAYDHWDFSMPAEIAAGPMVWRVTNNDPVLHHMIIFSYPAALNDEQVQSLLLAGEGMASPEAGLDLDSMIYRGGFGMISTGQAMCQQQEFDPGYYFAVCYLSDPGSETPHVMLGMIESFTVA